MFKLDAAFRSESRFYCPVFFSLHTVYTLNCMHRIKYIFTLVYIFAYINACYKSFIYIFSGKKGGTIFINATNSK